MERFERLYGLYEEYDTETLRDYRTFADVFPPLDSPVALEHWEEATAEITERAEGIRLAYPEEGETLAEVASYADRDQAFAALDLLSKYDRAVNVLVLDIDETLRSAGETDNEIPREALYLLTEFHEAGVPIVVCTGQTLENVKGFAIQGLGNALVYSGELSIVYEAGNGVFTPGMGPDTKQLLYEDLDEDVVAVFDRIRGRVHAEAPESVQRCTHLQGNEFNVTLKPNFETGSDRAETVVDEALVYLVDLVGESVAEVLAASVDGPAAARAHYADVDPEIRAVLEDAGARPDRDASSFPDAVVDFLSRIDVAYYEADAAEVGSAELDKVAGVEAALETLGVDDPFALVMGDSKSDLRVMEWAERHGSGISAAPEHSSKVVLDHVTDTDGLVFDRGDAVDPLRSVYAMNLLAEGASQSGAERLGR